MDLKKEIMDDIEKAQLSAEEILRKYDKESDKRELTGIWNTIINAICIVFCIFTESEDEIFTSLVNNSQIKLWGITEDELFIQAKANSMLLFPPVIRELD